jgi:U4/U6.U5 tri-snRNP component SNU23
VERSTLEQVRARIALLRERTKEASAAKSFDFDKRLAEVKDREVARREEKKAQKQAQKEEARILLAKESTMEVDDEMAAVMGFGGFGTTKK